MRALIHPHEGYTVSNLKRYLQVLAVLGIRSCTELACQTTTWCLMQKSGHDIIEWQHQETCKEAPGATWEDGLQQATAIFHVLHGHEDHARSTVYKLLGTTSSNSPVTFVGVSTPLTWAATPPPPLQQQSSSTAPDSNSCDTAASDRPTAGHQQSRSDALPYAVLEDRDASSRRPAAAALEAYHVEQLIMRCHRPGRLHTFIICPGILYGNGEDDSQLHALFQVAWQGREPLPLLGPGCNRLPTVHVADFAAYAEAVVQQQPKGQYVLAVDEEPVQQRELVTALGRLLRNKETRTWSPVDCLLQLPPSPLLQLDLPFAPSRLPQPLSTERCCPKGLLYHLPQVLHEYISTRNLTPLRILIRGPPAAGKTHMAQRLAEQYNLLLVNTANILAELPFMDAETQKAAHAQLTSKEGRISLQLMAKMAQHLLARHPEAAKQGWILEGWPKSLLAARLFTGSSMDDGGRASDRGTKKTPGSPSKDKKLTSSSGASGAAAVGRSRRTSFLSDDASEASQANADLLPTHLIELDAPDDELLRRVISLAAAEVAAVAAGALGTQFTASGRLRNKPSSAGKVTSSSGGGSAAGGDKAGAAGVPGSHNTEKEWGRRMEQYKQVIQEDAADLAAKRAAIYDALRTNTAGSESSESHSTTSAGRGRGKGNLGTDTDASIKLPADVQLPEHGGYVAYFVDAGAKYMHISNPFHEPASGAAANIIAGQIRHLLLQQQQQLPQQLPQQLQQQEDKQPLPPLPYEQQLLDWIGPPHNYQGFPTSNTSSSADANDIEGAPADTTGTAAAATVTGVGSNATVPELPLTGLANSNSAAVTGEVAELLAAAEALVADEACRDQQKVHRAAQPLISTLLASVMPALMAGLVETALHRPVNPCHLIADELLKAAVEIEASYKDPYADPVYAVQLEKVEAKAAREAARAAAAAAKAARDEAARAAAAAEAEAEAAAAAAVSNSSYSISSNTAAHKSDQQDGAAGAASRPVSAMGGVKPGARSPSKPAAAASRPASSVKAK